MAKKIKQKLYRLETCRFNRGERGEYESGILLNEGELGILDLNGEIVPEVWNWEHEEGFVIDLASIGFSFKP